ncbi:MAG: hypothetical protein DBW69_03075 [PS1 clade bacterium]|uniref:Uncharacterized protein n=1 Tax=PS1 clade bacterium TaxID=2175152 RepID=A0A368E206_9PROT|nr:MAG: hypothetical protein DBW69_03075 [PS1 clade bacterium]
MVLAAAAAVEVVGVCQNLHNLNKRRKSRLHLQMGRTLRLRQEILMDVETESFQAHVQSFTLYQPMKIIPNI